MSQYGPGDRPPTVRAPRKRKQPPPAPVPQTQLGAIPRLQSYPGHDQEIRQRKQAARAQPAPVVPHVPIIRNPTPAQTLAAKKVISHALTVQAGPGATPQQRRETFQRIADDPRSRHLALAANHYARMDERQTAEMLGRAMGVRGSRAAQARAGRVAVARQQQRDQVHPGRRDTKLRVAGLATVNASALQRAVIGATSLNTGDIGPREAFKKVAADATSLGTSPFIAGYETGAGVVDLARGRGPGRLEKQATDFVKQQVEMVKHPLKFAGQHPGLAALYLAGGVGALGRLAGAGARLTDAEIGSTVRPPLALGDDANASLVHRDYSKDVTRAAVQRTNDARREPLLDKQGDPVTTKVAGKTVPVLKARPAERERLLKGEANFRLARANAEERQVRDRVGKEFKVRGIRGPARDVVSMVVEGTVTSSKHFVEDLKAHGARIAGQLAAEAKDPGSVFRHPGEVKLAEHRLATVRRTLSSPKILAQADRIVAAGVDIGGRLNHMEKEAVRLGILNEKRAARSRLVVPAVEHMDARHFTPDELAKLGPEAGVSEEALAHGALRHPDGRFLSNADVHARLVEKGRDPATVAYLPHRYDVRGARAFHTQFRPGSRTMLDKPGVRTGSLYARGASEASPQLIAEQASRLATQITKTGHIDQMVGELGLKHPTGRHFTGKEATEVADRLEHTTGERLTPVRAFPAKAGKRTESIAKAEQGTLAAESLAERIFSKRLKVDAGAKNVVLLPTAVIEQTLAHLKPPGTIERFFQAVNPAFRFAVLPQFRWLTGNFVEPYLIRLPVEGSGLVNIPGLAMDLRATSKILKTMRESGDPAVVRASHMLEAQQVGQGLFIGGRGATVRRELRDFGRAGKAAAFFRDLPVMKQATDLFLMIPHSFFALNRVIESGAQRAAFGRLARRELRSFTGSWMKTVFLQREAMTEFARGLTDTATQRKLMKAQHRMLGQYEGFNPQVRRLVQSITPFVPWYLNALRFVYWTMPAHHTTLTALAVATGRTYQQDWEQMHSNVPPGSLKFAIPTKDGGWLDLARYTPWGATEEQLGGAVSWQSMLSQVAPQFGGFAAALDNKDPFGRDLQFPKDAAHPQGKATNPWELLPVAANQLAGSLIPGYSTAQRVRQGGSTPYATSSPFAPRVKPNTKHGSGVTRTINPLQATYLKKQAATVPTGGPSAPEDRLTQMRRQAAQRHAASSGSAERLRELRRAAAARAHH